MARLRSVPNLLTTKGKLFAKARLKLEIPAAEDFIFCRIGMRSQDNFFLSLYQIPAVFVLFCFFFLLFFFFTVHNAIASELLE